MLVLLRWEKLLVIIRDDQIDDSPHTSLQRWLSRILHNRNRIRLLSEDSDHVLGPNPILREAEDLTVKNAVR